MKVMKMTEYYKKMKDVLDNFFKGEAQIDKEIASVKLNYENLVDKTGMHEEIMALEDDRSQMKELYKESINSVVDEAKKAIRDWGRPTAEKLKDVEVLKLDLNEGDVIDLIEYHKDNPVMIVKLRDYAREKGFRDARTLSFQNDSVDDKLKDLERLHNLIIEGINMGESYVGRFIKHQSTWDKLIGE